MALHAVSLENGEHIALKVNFLDGGRDWLATGIERRRQTGLINAYQEG